MTLQGLDLDGIFSCGLLHAYSWGCGLPLARETCTPKSRVVLIPGKSGARNAYTTLCTAWGKSNWKQVQAALSLVLRSIEATFSPVPQTVRSAVLQDFALGLHNSHFRFR